MISELTKTNLGWRFQIAPNGLKWVFEKLRFRDGLVWTVGLTVEIKLRLKLLPGSGDGPKFFGWHRPPLW